MRWLIRDGIIFYAIASILTGIIASIIAIFVVPSLFIGLLYIIPRESGKLIGLIFLIVVIIVSSAAFAIRQHKPDVYGLIEIMFGAVTASVALTQYIALSSNSPEAVKQASDMLPDGGKYLFALLAGMYVIVRGLDNFGKFALSKGIKEGTLGRLWQALFVPVERVETTKARIEPK